MKESAYWDLFEQAAEALGRGQLAEAEKAFCLGHELAKENRLSLADRAYCNWAAVRMELGQCTGLREGLSRVLGESRDPKARQLAAYNLSGYYQTRNHRAARLYAEMSCRLAETLKDGHAQASSLHSLGLSWAGAGRLESARDCLRRSLEIRSHQEMSAPALVTTSAYAYCAALLGNRSEGAWFLGEALEGMKHSPFGVYEPAIRLNLGFAHLEWGENDEALEQGRAALQILEDLKSSDEKFARYLIGEALAQQGAEEEALHHFEILQKAFYPEHPGLAQVMLAVRTSRWMNWLG
jgi:tetratricopeptide (TPR) repeat protein